MASRAQQSQDEKSTADAERQAAIAKANDEEAAQSEWVHISHPDSEGAEPARVTRKSFDKKWSAKGYKIVDPTKTGTEADSSE